MRRGPKRILVGVVIVAMILAAVYAVALLKAQTRLRRAYAALAADGRPLQAAEVVPPFVAYSENAGPLFVAAARCLKTQTLGIRNLLDRLQTFSRRYVEGDIDPEDLDLLKDYLGQDVVVDALSLFEQGLQCPGCRFERDYDRGLWGDHNEARDMYGLLYIWWAKKKLDGGDGDGNGAWDKVLHQFRLAHALRQDPVFWSQITRNGMISRGCRSIQNLCATALPDEKTYQYLQQMLLELDDVTPLLWALDGERLLRGEALFNLPMGDLYEALLEEEFMYIKRGAFYRVLFAYLKFKPRFVADHATYLEVMHQGARILRLPYDPNTHQAFRELAHSSMLTSHLTPMADYAKSWACGMAANARMTRAGLALLKYRQKHGVYPATLDAVGLKGLSDPYSGEPLHYQADGEAFSIYSVGENQQDNQGKPRDREHKEYDDIAWHFPPLSERAKGGDPNEVKW